MGLVLAWAWRRGQVFRSTGRLKALSTRAANLPWEAHLRRELQCLAVRDDESEVLLRPGYGLSVTYRFRRSRHRRSSE